jgi:hypothetical protein
LLLAHRASGRIARKGRNRSGKSVTKYVGDLVARPSRGIPDWSSVT